MGTSVTMVGGFPNVFVAVIMPVLFYIMWPIVSVVPEIIL
jgi:hypothetical protein